LEDLLKNDLGEILILSEKTTRELVINGSKQEGLDDELISKTSEEFSC
jgi:hypothetical protein